MEPLSGDRRKAQLFELYRTVFGRPKASRFEERFDWQYIHSPARRPEQPGSWVLVADDAVVGHLGIMHQRVLVEGREVQGCWGCDLVVHPEHRRGKGVLDLFACLERSADLPMGYGMEDHVANIYERRGYRRLEIGSRLYRLLKPSATFRLAASGTPTQRAAEHLRRLWHFLRSGRTVARRAAGSETVVLESLPSSIDDLWQQIAADYPVSIVRDAQHLRWRYASEIFPARFLLLQEEGRLAGCAVLEALSWRGIRVAMISDLLVPRSGANATLATLLSAAENLARRSDLEAVMVEGLTPDLRQTVRRHGYRTVDRTSEHLVVQSNLPTLDTDRLAPAEQWLITAGDSDRTTPYPRIPFQGLA